VARDVLLKLSSLNNGIRRLNLILENYFYQTSSNIYLPAWLSPAI
jgi:hypothetical protein